MNQSLSWSYMNMFNTDLNSEKLIGTVMYTWTQSDITNLHSKHRMTSMLLILLYPSRPRNVQILVTWEQVATCWDRQNIDYHVVSCTSKPCSFSWGYSGRQVGVRIWRRDTKLQNSKPCAYIRSLIAEDKLNTLQSISSRRQRAV